MKEESGDRTAPIWKGMIRRKREWQARGCSLLFFGADGAYKECAPGCNMAGGMMGKERQAIRRAAPCIVPRLGTDGCGADEEIGVGGNRFSDRLRIVYGREACYNAG